MVSDFLTMNVGLEMFTGGLLNLTKNNLINLTIKVGYSWCHRNGSFCIQSSNQLDPSIPQYTDGVRYLYIIVT